MKRIKDMTVGEKLVCSKCGNTVSLTTGMKRRQRRQCPSCESKAAVEWARCNRTRKRAANNAYHKRISAKRAKRTALYRERHPEAKAAHQAIQTAIRNGSLKKEPCADCGEIKVHAHHDDYKKPLVVTWLCHKHHMEHHMLAAREKSNGTPRE